MGILLSYVLRWEPLESSVDPCDQNSVFSEQTDEALLRVTDKNSEIKNEVTDAKLREVSQLCKEETEQSKETNVSVTKPKPLDDYSSISTAEKIAELHSHPPKVDGFGVTKLENVSTRILCEGLVNVSGNDQYVSDDEKSSVGESLPEMLHFDDGIDSGRSSLTPEPNSEVFDMDMKGEVPDYSLSEEEIDAIAETWGPVWKERKRLAIDVFVKLFTMYPVAKSYFEDFKGLDVEEIRVHKKLRAHGLAVMYAIKSYIDSIDDDETFDALLRKNAMNHVERGVGEKEFKWLAPVFIAVLDDNIKDMLTDFHRKSWTKLFYAMAKVSREEWTSAKS